MEFKHSVAARLIIKSPFDYQDFSLKDADLAEFDTPKLAIAGIMTMLTNFLSTTKQAYVNAIELFSLTDSDKQYFVKSTARVRIKATGRKLNMSYKFGHDTAADYATYHSAGITALSTMIDSDLYAYDNASVEVFENPDYVPET